jgi:hypothetical protein
VRARAMRIFGNLRLIRLEVLFLHAAVLCACAAVTIWSNHHELEFRVNDQFCGHRETVPLLLVAPCGCAGVIPGEILPPHVTFVRKKI